MLEIENVVLTSYLTGYKVTQEPRGVEEVETLSGRIYKYSTGVGYKVSATMAKVPDAVLSSLLDTAGTPGKTYKAKFYAFGSEETADCYTENIDADLQLADDSGSFWAVSLEVRSA